jgi:solute carrier family 35 protein F1/2
MIACGKPLVILIGGQIISVLLALTGFISGNLANDGFIFPVFQSTGFYFLLSLFLLSRPFPLKISWLLYVLLGLFDVEANFLAVKAYQYTDITSILLLNSLTIPWIVVLSFFILKRRYSHRQIFAIVICLAGLGLVIASDTVRGRWDNTSEGNSAAWIGDLICVGSSFLYACQNVLQEYLLKRFGEAGVSPNGEYLGMLGLNGLLISTLQWALLEREVFNSYLWTSEVIGYIVGFSFTMLILYLVLAWYIAKFDASLFNMNILTSGIYGILIEVAQGEESLRKSSDWMYMLAYVLIVVGVVAYCRSEAVENVSESQCKSGVSSSD